MSFPNIPNITPSISLSRTDVVNLLLASVAFEELGLAHVINAEAEKIQAVLGTLPGQTTPLGTTFSDLITVDQSIRRVLQTALKTQMLLQFKLEDILDIPAPPVPQRRIFENIGTATGFFNGSSVSSSDNAFYNQLVS